MDIIITGGQGAGKTTAAHKLLTDRFGVKHLHNILLRELFIVTSVISPRVDVLRETIRSQRPEAVLFDEFINDEASLLLAVQAVKEVREQLGRDLYAVYIWQTDSTALTVVEYPKNFKL